jgi:hypothetical protein
VSLPEYRFGFEDPEFSRPMRGRAFKLVVPLSRFLLTSGQVTVAKNNLQMFKSSLRADRTIASQPAENDRAKSNSQR